MINFDAVDFSEHRSEEVITFFWRSVYHRSLFQTIARQLHSQSDDYHDDPDPA